MYSRGPEPARIHRTGCGVGQVAARRRAAASRSVGVVTLRARGSPATTRTRSPRRSTRPASSVAVARDGVRPLEHVAPEALGRLHRPQGRALGRRHDEAVLVDLLDGVDDRGAGHDGDGPGRDGGDHPVEDGDRRQAPGGVVDEDDLDVVAEHRQPGRDGVAPLGPARRRPSRARPTRAHGIRHRPRLGVTPGGRRGRRRRPRHTAAHDENPPQGVPQQGHPGEGHERLGRHRPPDANRSRPRRR